MLQSSFFAFELLSLFKVAERIFVHSIFEIVSKRLSYFVEDWASGKIVSFVTSQELDCSATETLARPRQTTDEATSPASYVWSKRRYPKVVKF